MANTVCAVSIKEADSCNLENMTFISRYFAQLSAHRLGYLLAPRQAQPIFPQAVARVDLEA